VLSVHAPATRVGPGLTGATSYIGGSNGTVERRDAVTHALLRTWTVGAPSPRSWCAGTYLYAGTSFGFVERGSRTAGGFAFWGTCGGPFTSIRGRFDAHHPGHAVGHSSTASRSRPGQLSRQFQVPSNATAMGRRGHLAPDRRTDGVVRRVNRGPALDELRHVDVPIQAMALSATEVGSRSASACPALRQRRSGRGCRNSTASARS
jgi:hypothetical protein